ncbi:MarR family winged helix-turn-helix transcriptional regulator [Pseudolysinimonas sp.]|jgi:DNA-binding MarR family transcriptional regulator|uniref:MarR family winged helix-turn-helix transcriptional regulator n=1 Tax=Pseudolysinimonas sp. TaxID=2680009 RepID=UPI003784CAF8
MASDALQGSALAREIEFLNARARSIGSAIANEMLQELGLRVRSYSVLALACGDLRPTQRQLAEFLRLDPSQIVALVDELEAPGFVRREADPADRRSKTVVATTAGEELYVRARVATARAEDLALAALTPAERERLRTLMTKIAFAPEEPTAPS